MTLTRSNSGKRFPAINSWTSCRTGWMLHYFQRKQIHDPRPNHHPRPAVHCQAVLREVRDVRLQSISRDTCRCKKNRGIPPAAGGAKGNLEGTGVFEVSLWVIE